MERSAQISACGRYRYELTRIWNLADPTVTWVMLNPSTADAETEDATSRRCIAFSRDWGYGALTIVNLFAWRSAKPSDMLQADDPIGAGNDDTILGACAAADLVLAAWGRHGAHLDRGAQVLTALRRAGAAIHCLAVLKDGQPAHPVRLARALTPIAF